MAPRPSLGPLFHPIPSAASRIIMSKNFLALPAGLRNIASFTTLPPRISPFLFPSGGSGLSPEPSLPPTLPEIKRQAAARAMRKLSTGLTLHSLGQGASFFKARSRSMRRWVYGPHELNLVQNPILEPIFVHRVIPSHPLPPIPFSSQLCRPLEAGFQGGSCGSASQCPALLLDSSIVAADVTIDSLRSPRHGRDSFTSFSFFPFYFFYLYIF